MERVYKFVTLFKNKRKWSVDAILHVFEQCKLSYVGMKIGKRDNTILVLEGTEDNYLAFSKVVEKMYPGLCAFDI